MIITKMDTKLFTTITYNDKFVDLSLLDKGIYSTNIPKLYPISETIDNIIEGLLEMKDMNGNYFISDEEIKNLKKCKMSIVEIKIYELEDF